MKKIISLILCLVLILSILPASVLATETVATTSADTAEDLVQYANPLIGTDNFKGNSEFAGLAPFVTAPFGMTNFTPQTRENYIGGISYQYSDSYISGFFASHQPAIWMGDYGYFNVMPQIGDVNPSLDGRKLPFSHDDEISTPYYYQVTMGEDEQQITGEMTATERCAIYRFEFPATEQANILVESARGSGSGSVTVDLENNEIYGWNNHNMSSYLNNDPPENLKGYFVIQFREVSPETTGSGVYLNYQVQANQTSAEGQKSGAYITFDTTGETKVIEMLVGTSFVSVEQARVNIQQEIGEQTFDDVKNALKNTWNEKLNTIELEGASEDELYIFYTAMYHAMLYPRMFYETTAEGKNIYFSPYDDQYHEGKSYTDFSIWDTFRAQNSFLTLVAPERINDMVTSLLQNYQEGGYMPKWPNPGYTNIMIGTHADSLVAEAIQKGLLDESLYELAYEAVFKDAMAPQEGDGTIKWADRQSGVPYEARGGLGCYKALGYVANGYANENVSRTVEFAYDDWCVAQVALAVGEEEAYQYFLNRSLNYKNVLNPETGYLMGRDVDGNFTTSGEQFTEGDRRKYTWFAPHDPQGLLELMTEYQGPDFYNDELEKAFGESGWLEQQNEPCHNYAYMFDFSGRPDLTQKYARQTLVESYSNDYAGMLGNDDCGQMSAWYIFSAMGFYPVNPASGEYMIGSPIFDKVTIHNPKTGTDFVITAENNRDPDNYYIQSAMLNGSALNIPVVTYEQITAGGTLSFVMGNTASTWAQDYAKEAIEYVEGVEIDDPYASDPFFGDSTVNWTCENLAPSAEITVTGDQYITGGDLDDPNVSLKDGNLSCGFKSTNQTASGLLSTPYYITMTWEQPQTLDTLYIYSNYGQAQGPKKIDVEVTTDGTEWTTILSDFVLNWTSNGESAEKLGAAFEQQTGVLGLRFRVKEAGLTWGGFAIRELECYAEKDLNAIDLAAPRSLSFRVNFNHNELLGITMDGVELEPDLDYTVDEENGKILILSEAFADSQIGSSVPLQFVFDQGACPVFSLRLYENGSIDANFIGNLGLNVVSVEVPDGWMQPNGGDVGEPITMFDGSHAVGYASVSNPTYPHTITAAFEEKQAVDSVRIYSNYGKSQGPTEVSVLVSEDGETWKPVVENVSYSWQTDDNSGSEAFEICFPAVETNVQYLQIQILKANTVWSKICIREIEIGCSKEQSFTPDQAQDIAVALDMQGTELKEICDNSGTLVQGVDYNLSEDGNTVTLLAAYLQKQSEHQTLSFVAESGKQAQLKLWNADRWVKVDIVGYLTNLTGNTTFLDMDAELNYILTADDGYELPETVSVTMGGKLLMAGTDYTYSKESGCITIESVTGEVTITAAGMLKTYTVTFVTDNDTEIPSQLVSHGSTVDQPETPVKKGCTFAGWYTDASFTEKYNFDAAVTSDFTLYAKWTKNSSSGSSTTQYTITVKQSESGTISPSTIKVERGASQTFVIKANPGYAIADVLVDGKSVGAVTSYTFKNVSASHTITATFQAAQSGLPFTDVSDRDWYYNEVTYVYKNQLMNGTNATSFTPNGTLNRAMLATILYRMEGSPKVSAKNPFYDVEYGTWYTDAVLWAAENGIVTGFSDGSFKPMDNITREQMATMLYRYASLKQYDTTATTRLSSFVDASQVSTWALDAMKWANAKGLITGKTGAKLDPLGNATRAEAAAILMRFCELNKD